MKKNANMYFLTRQSLTTTAKLININFPLQITKVNLSMGNAFYKCYRAALHVTVPHMWLQPASFTCMLKTIRTCLAGMQFRHIHDCQQCV